MKHKWAPAVFTPVGEKALYISKDICKHCGLERFAWISGSWKTFNYYRGPTKYPFRPDCVKPLENKVFL